jgi:adenosine kinase
VCVTLDERGCAAYWLDERGDLAEQIVPRIPIEHVVDTTGAGDSFAAGLAFGYLQDGDIVRAAQYGNAMGAQRCTGSTLDVYLPLPQTNKQLADTYGTTGDG